MQVRALALVLALCLPACYGDTQERGRLARARIERSVLDLAGYIEEGGEYEEEASALIDAHYEHAIASLPEEDEFRQALLAYLRQSKNPRLSLYLAPPKLSSEASAVIRSHFQSSPFSLVVVEGASKGARRAYEDELVVFKDPSDPKTGEAELHLQWTVAPSGFVLLRPSELMRAWNPTGPNTVEGIAIQATLSFSIPGHAEPFRFQRKTAPEQFSYKSYTGALRPFGSTSDMYSGLVASAFEELIFQLLEAGA